MTNDILEQVTSDYFILQGYFIQHNIPYRPNDKGVHSDIDVLAVDPKMKLGDPSRVKVISCKSGQNGVDLSLILKRLNTDRKRIIREGIVEDRYRELINKPWSKALKEKVSNLTGQDNFTFVLAATFFKGDRSLFTEFPEFKENLPDCKIELLDFKEMISKIQGKPNTTPAHSELGRLLQLVSASGGKVTYNN